MPLSRLPPLPQVIRRAACPPANGANNISPYSAVLALNSGLGRYSSALP